jgi:hypothetical protein
MKPSHNMPSETYTGRLINEEAQVSIENGPILAVRGPNPCATAAGKYASWGQTQPVTVTGDAGTVDNIDVLFVTSIHWAAQAPAVGFGESISEGGAASIDELISPAPVKKIVQKSAPQKSRRKRN